MIRVFEFKCIASLSGQFMCGSKQCHEIEGLASYEACIFRKFLNDFFSMSLCVSDYLVKLVEFAGEFFLSRSWRTQTSPC